jgi:hypothetical protein
MEIETSHPILHLAGLLLLISLIALLLLVHFLRSFYASARHEKKQKQ